MVPGGIFPVLSCLKKADEDVYGRSTNCALTWSSAGRPVSQRHAGPGESRRRSRSGSCCMPMARLGKAVLRIWGTRQVRDITVFEAGRTLLPGRVGPFCPVHASRTQAGRRSAVPGRAEALRAWGRYRQRRESTAGAAEQPGADSSGRSSWRSESKSVWSVQITIQAVQDGRQQSWFHVAREKMVCSAKEVTVARCATARARTRCARHARLCARSRTFAVHSLLETSMFLLSTATLHKGCYSCLTNDVPLTKSSCAHKSRHGCDQASTLHVLS